jgi:hypothetical protein
MSLPQLITDMEEAGTVDLRGRELLPYLLPVLTSRRIHSAAARSAVSTLRAWLKSGAHRIDRNKDGHYDHAAAVRIMDVWFPKLLQAEFGPALGSSLFDSLRAQQRFDDTPHQHLGSAYNGGWYQYVQKDLRDLLGKSVRGPYSRVYCGGGKLGKCRSRLLGSLKASLGEDPYGENSGCGVGDDQMCYDAVKFRAVGAVGQPDLPWINRPTFQQAVQVQHHR